MFFQVDADCGRLALRGEVPVFPVFQHPQAEAAAMLHDGLEPRHSRLLQLRLEAAVQPHHAVSSRFQAGAGRVDGRHERDWGLGIRDWKKDEG